MVFKEKELNLKDGRKCVLRSVDSKDAAEMIEYLRLVSRESKFLTRYADEINIIVEEEEKFIENKRSAPRELMMAADVEGVFAGICSIITKGDMRRVWHRCDFSIALKQEFCDAGLGTEMVEYAMCLAKKLGYEQVELGVIEGNNRAKHLYEKIGFTQMGKVLNALKYDDGSYRDEFLMVKLL